MTPSKRAVAGTLAAATAAALTLVGCGSSSSTPSVSPSTSSASPSSSSTKTVKVTSLAAVCPKLIVATNALPTGSVSNEQIAGFVATLNDLKAEVPVADQDSITALANAYQRLEDANDNDAITAAQAEVTAATQGMDAACAAVIR